MRRYATIFLPSHNLRRLNINIEFETLRWIFTRDDQDFWLNKLLQEDRAGQEFWTGIYVQYSAGYLNMYTSFGGPRNGTKHFTKIRRLSKDKLLRYVDYSPNGNVWTY